MLCKAVWALCARKSAESWGLGVDRGVSLSSEDS